MTIADRATRLTARVAPYRAAIEVARKAGLTWRDLATLLGVKTPDRLRWAVGHCSRYEADQVALPMPEPQPQPKPDSESKTIGAARPTPAPDVDEQSAIDRIVANKNLIK